MCGPARLDDRIALYKMGLADSFPGPKMCIWSTNDEINRGNARMTPYFEGRRDFGQDKQKACMEVVYTDTLDHLLFDTHGLARRVDVMKIDIEGFETRAFRGAALTHAYKATIRAAGLGTIMTRSGLELDVGAIRRAGRVAARLTVLPGVSEALAVALFARWVFELPFVLALALGFILAAVSPAVVLVYVFEPDRLELVDNERWLRGDWRPVTLVRTRDDWEPAPAPPRAARVAATAAARRSAAPPPSM